MGGGAVFALVFLAGGLIAPGLTVRTGYLMSLALVAIALGLLAALEAARALTGQSVIGQFVREVMSR